MVVLVERETRPLLVQIANFGRVAICELDIARSSWDLTETFVSETVSRMKESHGDDRN
jgi:hypothetical protein